VEANATTPCAGDGRPRGLDFLILDAPMPKSSRRVRVDTAGIYRPHLRDGLVRRPVGALFSAVGAVVAQLRAAPVLPVLPSLPPILRVVEALRGPCTVIGAPGAVRAVTALPRALGLDAGLRVVEAPEDLEAGEGTWVALLGAPWVADAVDTIVAAKGRVLVVGLGEDGEEVRPPEGGFWLSDPVAGDGRFGASSAGAWAVAGICGADVEALADSTSEMRRDVESAELGGHPSWPWAIGLHGLASEQQREDGVHLYTTNRLSTLAAWAAGVFGSVLAGTVRGPTLRQRHGGRCFAAQMGDEEVVEAVIHGNTSAHIVTWELGASEQRDIVVALAHEAGVPTFRVRFDALDLRSVVAVMVLVQHAAVATALLLGRDPGSFAGAHALRVGVRKVDAAEGAE
jgi:hypothetical protein